VTTPVRIAVLGSTGSIGRQTLEVIAAFPERFELVGLCAGRNAQLLAEQVQAYRPALAALADSSRMGELRSGVPSELAGRLRAGPEGVEEIAAMPEADVVVAAVVGQAGLDGVLTAVRAGKRVALANKEALVMAGELVVALAERSGAKLVPVDSEHASLAQLLQGRAPASVRRVVLTASGGPFLNHRLEELSQVAPADALAHPNWDMGSKISIDSATMMNKGFEVIEARWLFGIAPERIDVLIHPESLVHALVELIDGGLLAHLGPPDMRLPIAWALGRPERLDLTRRLRGVTALDLAGLGPLTFLRADPARWPAVSLCRQDLDAGGGMPAALAAADEVLVEAFLAGRLRFTDITRLLEAVLSSMSKFGAATIEEIRAAGLEGGRLAAELIEGR